MAINDEFISFGDPTKNSRIVENEAVALRIGLLGEEQSRRQAGEASSHYNALLYLACLRRFRWRFVILAIAHRMRVLDHSIGIARRGLVVALAAISSPARTDFTGSLGTEGKRTEPSKQPIRGGKQDSVEEITTGNRLVETEEPIEMRA